MKKALLVCTLLVNIGICALAGEHSKITFSLVPKKGPSPSQLAEDTFLPEGTVRLYRRGTYTAGLQLPLNQPTSVPPGDWIWVAEAPGYVSVSSGLLRLGTESADRRLVWPVVPACEISLEPNEWERISRLDVVSLDFGATYPVQPKQRQRFQVPAGQFIAYTMKGNSLIAWVNLKRQGCIPPIPTCPTTSTTSSGNGGRPFAGCDGKKLRFGGDTEEEVRV